MNPHNFDTSNGRDGRCTKCGTQPPSLIACAFADPLPAGKSQQIWFMEFDRLPVDVIL
jgi:hypothetical protein